jgi:hypothetical protein
VVDYARTRGRRSDETAILAANIFEDLTGNKCFDILDVQAEKWAIRELPAAIVTAAAKYQPSSIHIERLSNWELLQDALVLKASQRHVELGRVSFFKPDKKLLAKATRLRRFHRLCANGMIHFKQGNYIDKVFSQLEKFDFQSRTNRTAKDDAGDVCGLLVTHC